LDFFWLKNQKYDLAEIPSWGIKGLISWGLGSIVALLTYFDFFQLTPAHFIDSFLIAGVIYFFLNQSNKG